MIDKHFETNEKISNRIDESNAPFYNTIHDGLDEFTFFFIVLFLEKAAFDLLFIAAWLSLVTSGEATSWITFTCSLVCWGCFFVDGESVGAWPLRRRGHIGRRGGLWPVAGCLRLARFSIWRVGWALGYHPMGFRHSPDVS